MTPLPLALLIVLGLGTMAFILCRRRWRETLENQAARHEDALASEREHQIAHSWRLLDALPDSVFTVSAEGRILRANKEARITFGERILKDGTLEESLLEPDLIAPIRESLKSGEPISKLITLAARALPGAANSESATESHWLMQIDRVASKEPPSTLLVILRDVTSNIQSDQVRKDFVANASHELRTPLAIIGGYLENFIEDDLLHEPEQAQHALGVMQKHTERINRIVDDMLVISRLESGEASALKISQFRIDECIADVIERLDPLIKQQGATVKVDLPDPDLSLDGDRFYWIQVLFNLIENALKQNSTIRVEITVSAARDEKGNFRMDVTDNGVGIPSADLPYIFKRFFRVEKHHSQGGVRGTGLGLSIVKRAVEAHGGTITATSTPGVATCFTALVPVK